MAPADRDPRHYTILIRSDEHSDGTDMRHIANIDMQTIAQETSILSVYSRSLTITAISIDAVPLLQPHIKLIHRLRGKGDVVEKQPEPCPYQPQLIGLQRAARRVGSEREEQEQVGMS